MACRVPRIWEVTSLARERSLNARTLWVNSSSAPAGAISRLTSSSSVTSFEYSSKMACRVLEPGPRRVEPGLLPGAEGVVQRRLGRAVGGDVPVDERLLVGEGVVQVLLVPIAEREVPRLHVAGGDVALALHLVHQGGDLAAELGQLASPVERPYVAH
jgi:hypothetical protein